MRGRPAVVIGGGIAGLLAADHLAAGGSAVTLLEASTRVGGLLWTERLDGLVLENGPDAVVSSKPAGLALVRGLGLEEELVPSAAGAASVLWDGRLHPIPSGTVLGIPTRLEALTGSGLFSGDDVERMARDLELAPRPVDGDESVGSLVRRRLGDALVERLVAPLLGGIHAADIDSLSVRASFPQLGAWEREHGSLIAGARAALAAGSSEPPFRSLRAGMASLAAALADRARAAGARLLPGCAVQRLGVTRGGWAVRTVAGTTFRAATVTLAVPPHAASALLAAVAPGAADALAGMRASSTAVVHLCYPRGAMAAGAVGHGFVVAPGEGRAVSGLTDVSHKWPHRADPGRLLLRAFAREALGTDEAPASDVAIAAAVGDDVAAILGIAAEPTLALVRRLPRASPLLRVGHLEQVAAIRRTLAAEAPGIVLVGGAYDGVGIPALAAAVPAHLGVAATHEPRRA